MIVWFSGGGTGGHLYPGLAIARALRRADERIQPYFIGAQRGIERDVLPTTEFGFTLLDLHPLYRSAPWRNWRTLTGGMHAWRQITALAQEHQPAAVVATGGYAAGIALLYAQRRGVPYVLQEQNSFPGATVRWFANGARQIHLGFPEAKHGLRVTARTQLFDSGNPIESPPTILPARAYAQAGWGFPPVVQKTMLVFGGSQGAEAINQVVAAWIQRGGPIESGLRVIWATGKAAYERYAALESDLVKIRPYISPMTSAYSAVDFAVSRAGAMATAEMAAWGLPMILIPLPTAAADHQTANAKAIAESGAAIMIRQEALTADAFDGAIRRIATNEQTLDAMRVAALRRARPNAADDIAAHILDLPPFQSLHSSR